MSLLPAPGDKPNSGSNHEITGTILSDELCHSSVACRAFIVLNLYISFEILNWDLNENLLLFMSWRPTCLRN